MPTRSAGQPGTEATQVKLPPFPQGMKRRWLWVLHAFRTIAAAMGITLSFGIEGAKRIQRRPDGGYDVFGLDEGAATTTSPPLTVEADGTVVVGTVGGVIPTINAVAISALPAPVLDIDPDEESQFIVLNITGSFSVDSGVYVQGMTSIASVTITVETVDPGDAGSRSDSGEFKVVLATFYKAEEEVVTKTGQPISGSQNVQVCDDGTGTATGVLHLTSNIPS